MKKISVLLSVALLTLSFSLQAASSDQSNATKQQVATNKEGSTQEKFDIMERDENEDTDTLAIPFDESEVEDEEELDQLEGKDEFGLPQYQHHQQTNQK